MVFIPPFHDHSLASTFDAMVARLRSVVGEAEHGGHVEVPAVSVGTEVLVWSRDERPVAFVSLCYDWIRLRFASTYRDVHGLAEEPLDDVLDRVETALREGLAAVEALGPRAPGDVSGDEPSHRADHDAELAGVDLEQWSGDLLVELLSERGFGPGAIDLPIVLPAVRAWLGRAAPRTQVTMDECSVELYDWPGDDSTHCAPPPESLPEGAAWVGVGVGRSLKREHDGGEGLVSVNGGFLQLWYPTDDDWRSLLPDLDLQPDSLVSFEAYGHAGSSSGWLLSYPLIERIFATAATKHAALACLWTGEDEQEIQGR